MRKILLTTCLLAVSTSSAFANNYDSAASVRDGLNTVYTDLSGDWNGSTAATEYAELLYQIDNIGDDVNAIVISIDPTTGHVSTNDPSVQGGFSIAEIEAQVLDFTGALNDNLFGGSHLNSDVDTYAGLAGDQLTLIITEANRRNDIAMNAATRDERNAAFDGWTDYFNNAAEPFNNAVDALSSLTANLVETNFSNYALGGTDTGGKDSSGAAITNGGLNYNSYTDFVIGNSYSYDPVPTANTFILNNYPYPANAYVPGIWEHTNDPTAATATYTNTLTGKVVTITATLSGSGTPEYTNNLGHTHFNILNVLQNAGVDATSTP